MSKYWTKSWNPLTVKGGGYHCTKCSPGCKNCWAEQINMRFGNKLPYDDRPVEYVLDEKALQKPLHWRKPQTIFVCDLCDIFHEQVAWMWVDAVFIYTFATLRHKYLFLTKRPECVLEYSQRHRSVKFWNNPNIWLGVTVCNQAEADEKIPILLQIPVAKRWVSIEPLLSELDLSRFLLPQFEHITGLFKGNAPVHIKPDWLVIGCERLAGNRAGRFCEDEPRWYQVALNIIEQCKAAYLPVFVKQIPLNKKVSTNMADWPPTLRIREMP